MRILLCTDGSDEAAKAVRFGLLIARGSNQPIDLLGVIEDRRESEAIRSNIEVLAAEFTTIGAQCEVKFRQGNAAEQILDEAETWRADLIVVGRSGQRGLTRFLLGGTATRIVQYASCSVLLVKNAPPVLNKVLVCTAGGEPGLQDVESAGRVAEFAQAQVTVLHVMSQVPLAGDAYLPDLDASADELIARGTREGLHFKAALQTLASRSVQGVAKVRHGFVVDEILAELREGDYELLVIGAHIARGLTRWLLDDVTAHLLEDANLPVLVVRGP
jgi:nucleotide-binding universal stress UspA family protein